MAHPWKFIHGSETLGKWVYGSLFLVVLPWLLFQWSYWASPNLTLDPVHAPKTGMTLFVIGVSFLCWSMLVLIRRGKGLPMNAYPPPVFVASGPYHLVRHPIYWGFLVAFLGIAIWSGSSVAFWLEFPFLALCILSLLLGHESIDLKKRFPGITHDVLLELPQKSVEKPSLLQMSISLAFVMACWYLLVKFALYIFGIGTNINSGHLFPDFDPLSGGLVSFFSITVTPFFLKRQDMLRKWTVQSLVGLATACWILVMMPYVTASFLPLIPNRNLRSEQELIWIFTSAPVFLLLPSAFVLESSFPVFRYVLRTGYGVMAIAASLNSSSPAGYWIAGISVYLFSSNLGSIWEFVRSRSEKLANSWKEWSFGPVRVLNRGLYVGFTAAAISMLGGYLGGQGVAWYLLLFGTICVICGALWAQLIEGSDKLKRPFGYYGGLLGVVVSASILRLMHADVWMIIALASVMATFGQGLGRLGCLVNGCCHGSRVNDPLTGIRYEHPRTRVCGISHLKGQLIHPTQTYSLLWLCFSGTLLLRLWTTGAAYPFLFGVYLILTSLGRFVEEAYRGEVQTPVKWGLRLYQWTALTALFAGVGMTCIHVDRVYVPPSFDPKTVVPSLLFGIFMFFSMGVDFPASQARFSRLV